MHLHAFSAFKIVKKYICCDEKALNIIRSPSANLPHNNPDTRIFAT